VLKCNLEGFQNFVRVTKDLKNGSFGFQWKDTLMIRRIVREMTMQYLKFEKSSFPEKMCHNKINLNTKTYQN